MATLHALRQQIGTAGILKEVVEIHRNISSLRFALLKSRSEEEVAIMTALRAVLGAVLRHAAIAAPEGPPRLLIAIASNRGFCGDYNALVLRSFEEQRKLLRPEDATMTVGDTLAACKARVHRGFPETGLGTQASTSMRDETVRACIQCIRQAAGEGKSHLGGIGWWRNGLPAVRVVLLPSPEHISIPGGGGTGAMAHGAEYRHAVVLDPWDVVYHGLPHASWTGSDAPTPTEILRISQNGEMLAIAPQLWLPQAGLEIGPEVDSILGLILETYLTHMFSFLFFAAECEENERRMKSTNSIAENIDKEIGKLRNDVNKTRQSMITRELTELISGAKAFQKLRVK
jgi:F0F1-type ATP synthase gamma subunit